MNRLAAFAVVFMALAGGVFFWIQKSADSATLVQTGHAIIDRIQRQERQKDATCWTTIRTMEHFFYRETADL